MFEIHEENNYTKIVIKGKLKHSDYIDTLIPKLDQLSKNSTMKIMAVAFDFSGIELKAMLDDFKTGLKHRKDFQKLAVVTDKTWMKVGVEIFKHIITGDVQVFEKESEAELWLIE
jgi:hypothetical protein